MLWSLLFWTLPWLVLGAYVAVFVRDPPPLPGTLSDLKIDGTPPFVSVIVPARNEAHNIATCVRSLVASDYPDFEVIVVDDRSDDGTGAVARAVQIGRAARKIVVDGAPVPPGWFGKQWACWQGMQEARGDLLLFTDADTIHGELLMARAVAGLHRDRADCLTIIGRQIMGSFWERLVQPQIFALLAFRYPLMGREPVDQRRWRSAIANGQYLLFQRASYQETGGHVAVRYEAAEDLRFAQHLVRLGRRVVVRSAHDDFATRMYRGLGEIVTGWSKNMVQAGLQTIPRGLRSSVPALMFLAGIVLWLLPPLVLVIALLGFGGRAWFLWSAGVTSFLMLSWTAWGVRFGAPAWVGPLYPLGSLLGLWIFARSWLSRSRVDRKGRTYAWDVYSDAGEDFPPSAQPSGPVSAGADPLT